MEYCVHDDRHHKVQESLVCCVASLHKGARIRRMLLGESMQCLLSTFLQSCFDHLTNWHLTNWFLADAMPSVVQGRISHDHATCTHAFAAAVCCANTMAPPICAHDLPVSSNLHRQQRLLTNEALEGALGVD